MAEVVYLPGSGGPVNDGERRVVEYLRTHLPDDGYLVFPNIEMVHPDRIDELDAVVLTPFGLTVVEVKDLAGEVLIAERECFVDRRPRSQPFLLTHAKARRSKSRLASADRGLPSVWVSALVVLARSPEHLQLHPSMTDRIVLRERAVELLTDPAGLHGPPRRSEVGHLHTRIRNALGLTSRPRDRRPSFGAYETEELLGEDDFERLWRGTNTITGEQVELRHLGISESDSAGRARRIERAGGELRAMAAMGTDQTVRGPREILPQDDGSIVVVSAAAVGWPLRELLEDPEGQEVDRGRLLLDVVRAVAHAHAAGVAHRRLTPGRIEVGADGGAVVGGFSLGSFPSGPDTITLEAEPDGAFLAPEVLARDKPAGAAADLYSLGRLIGLLWDEQDQSDEAAQMRAVADYLTRPDPAERNPSADYLRRALEGVGEPSGVEPITPPLPAPGERLTAGSIVDEYVIERFLGAGAHSEVYEAYEPLADRKVALKRFLRTGAGPQLEREYRILQRIDNPHVARALHAAHSAEIGSYLVSEYLEGPTVAQAIDEEQLDEPAAVGIVLDLLDAFRAIHPRSDQDGVVHRDVKPENVVLADRGAVLFDFGISSMEVDGPPAGTPEYRPPDADPSDADPDLDLFACAVILAEAARGEHPFPNRDPSLGPPSLDGLSDDLRPILHRALAPDRTDRFRTADDFLDALATAGLTAPTPLPRYEGARDLYNRVRELVAAGSLEEARTLCPPHWRQLLRIIDRRLTAQDDSSPSDGLATESGLIVRRARSGRTTVSQTPAGETGIDADEVIFEVTGPPGLLVDVRLVKADNGETWVDVPAAYDSHPAMKRLEHGLRLGCHPLMDGRYFAELRVARLKDNDWSAVFKASLEELASVARVDVSAELARFGALGTGTREELFGDDSKNRSFSAVVFAPDNVEVPVMAFALTRIAPLARAVGLLDA